MPIDYQLGKIYKIVSDQTDKIYIGSTAMPRLCQRMSGHKMNYRRTQAGAKHYVSSFEIMKFEDAKIVLVELFPCESKDELLAREQYWIDYHKASTVNKMKAFIDMDRKEYVHSHYLENIDKYKKRSKQQQETKPEEYKAYQKQYRIDNADKSKQYNQEYAVANAETLKQYRSEYYTNNVEKINQKQRRKVICPCGKEHAYGSKSQHLKSKHHQAFLAEQQVTSTLGSE